MEIKYIVLKNGINAFKMDFKMILPMIKLLFILMISFGCQSAEHEIIIVPEGYTGYIIIIYGNSSGENKEYSNGSRVYNIPQNGILVSQFPNNPGWSGFPKFYYDSIALENEIPFISDFKDLHENEVTAFGGTTGGVNIDLKGNEIIRFKQYYIGNKSQILNSIDAAEKFDIRKHIKR